MKGDIQPGLHQNILGTLPETNSSLLKMGAHLQSLEILNLVSPPFLRPKTVAVLGRVSFFFLQGENQVRSEWFSGLHCSLE